MSKIARRKFIQLSAVAAAGCFVRPGRDAEAQNLPRLTEDDPMAVALKYTHDASTVDAASRPQPAAEQTCANCAQLTGNEGDEWRPCNIFVGKVVNSNGWCSVWVPKG
jgi:High potential iron-sulfur protein